MADAFVRTVVHIGEVGLPSLLQGARVDGKSMILTRDQTAVATLDAHRLIVRPMPIFELVDAGTRCLGKKLIAHADPHQRTTLFRIVDEATDMLHCLFTHLRVARTIRQEKPVELQPVEVIIPGN